MELRFLGGAREVGRSAVEVDGRLLLDYGVKTGTPPEFPVDSTISPEAVIASHGHLDHVGLIPALMSDRPPVHQTPVTRDLTRLLADDTLDIQKHHRAPFTREDVSRLAETASVHPYGGVFEAAGHTCRFADAGHIPGSAQVLVEGEGAPDGGTRLLYSGDVNATATRLLDPAAEPPPADALVVESTYFDHEHTPREQLERAFVDSVRETLYEGGDVIVPVFAIGRTQEILMVLEAHDVPCYVDGMGTDVTHIAREYPEYLRDPRGLKRAWNHAETVDPRDRDAALGDGRAIVTTAGMLSGGPALHYLPKIHDDPTNKICLTGYQVEDTPGRRALDEGRIEVDGRVLPLSCQVELHDFSAHADDAGLKAYVEAAVANGVERVIAVHGDEPSCVALADWARESLGVAAEAPSVGDTLEV